MARVHLVDYGMGNLRSVAGAIRHLGHEPVICADSEEIGQAERLVLPGVGAFGQAMENLRRRNLVEPLTRLVQGRKVPILGICLGAQLLCKSSEEFGTHTGLGWLDAHVRNLTPDVGGLRVPHVGWDDLEIRTQSPLFDEIGGSSLFYYVHTYRMVADNAEQVAAECNYGCRFAAVLTRENVAAVQFHPEKSQQAGLTLLRNFIERFRHA